MDFRQIIGHEKAIETLKRQIKNGSISHSYIFEGEEGLGKSNVALAFAKTLLCKEQEEEPCNHCTSCMKFESGNHPDLLFIEPEKGLIKKGEIEKLIKSVVTAPFESLRKVFIIDDSHKMNTEGMNALLKTLEEPPEYINMILITSATNKILPTILSRCQNIKFYPVETKKIIELLEGSYGKSENEAKFIADFTKGSIGKSIELATSDDFFIKRQEIIKLIDNLLKGDRTKAISSFGFFNENKESIDEILDIFLFWFRDLMLYKKIGDNPLIINRDKLEYISRQSFIDSDKINDIIEKVQQTKEYIRGNINLQLSIETMLLNIQEEL
ncbi:DNA polymerase III subunit delta' [Tissierella sp. Yu-01]|uniref:DNA polymerase III subunit delta' n=1 Tax=Tissierella sp. Yu-01 TaxID=3035694 RepID=UPI00240E8623|nr:DNA polymerase III subunit delta' [Tissierella sp. Yu-01]WFA08487.1 DNA polymerase III subunit delta' [Tissierella sp. Yu-01]